MDTFLKWLSGKKSTIALILSLLLGYCFSKAYIDQATFALFSGILLIMFPSLSYATKQAYKK